MKPSQAAQASLDFDATRREGLIQGRFLAFHKEHPEVYRELVRLARELKAKGRERYSIDSLFHVLRWHRSLKGGAPEDFKLNDHYTSRYARLIMAQERDLSTFFEIRRLNELGRRLR